MNSYEKVSLQERLEDWMEKNSKKRSEPSAARGKKKKQQENLIMTIGIVAVVAAAAVALFLLMTIGRNREDKPADTPSSLISSQGMVSTTTSGTGQGLPTGSVSAITQMDDPLLVLVNQYNKMPSNYEHTLIEIHDTTMDERIRKPFEDMYNAAAADGAILWISSCYRTAEKQEELFEREIQDNLSSGMSSSEATAAAQIAVARGGYSEHNTGLAIDLNGVSPNFLETDAGKWMAEHAEEYGFILRFPKEKEAETGIMYEPWHYRYVGKEHALKMKELGMCLEEYIDYLKQAAQ